ncbi:hypothetical protein ACE6H2_024735 [Prunus campanulata]
MATNKSTEEEKGPEKVSNKGRSCKGTLYYSTALKSKAYNPICLGVPRTLPQDVREVPQTQRHQPPTQSAGTVFLNKFSRNADLVASGVTKNVYKVGNYIKGSLSDFLFPYRGRSK